MIAFHSLCFDGISFGLLSLVPRRLERSFSQSVFLFRLTCGSRVFVTCSVNIYSKHLVGANAKSWSLTSSGGLVYCQALISGTQVSGNPNTLPNNKFNCLLYAYLPLYLDIGSFLIVAELRCLNLPFCIACTFCYPIGAKKVASTK